MRIIGGEAKGRRIYLPKGCQLRPTSDRIKEALFNILHSMDGKIFLDLFAGSGSIGLEALSRGATRVVFIDNDWNMVNAIKKNVDNFGFHTRSAILTMEVGRAIQKLKVKGEKFDILFADPPYEKGLINKTLQYLEDGKLLTRHALTVIQHSIRETLPETLAEHDLLIDQRRSGDTTLSFLKLNPGE